jgi:hypothetical protein
MGCKALLVVLLAAATTLPGCCSIARALCPVEQPLVGDTRLTRDTPAESLDYLVSAFRDRRIGDIYDSLHPDFRARYGDFSLAEFTSAFEEYEDLFQQDAEALRTAERATTRMNPERTHGAIAVRNDDMGAIVIFRRRDVAYVKLDDDFVSESRVLTPPIGTLVSVDADGWVVPMQPIRFEELGGVDPASIQRLEYRQEWLVHELRDVRGVRFLERIEEEF